MSSFLVPMPPGAHPSSSSTQPLDDAPIGRSKFQIQQGWPRITACLRGVARELRVLVRQESLREAVREILLSNLSVLNSLRQVPCTHTVLRQKELLKLCKPFGAVFKRRQNGAVVQQQDAATREFLSAVSCVSNVVDLQNAFQMCLDLVPLRSEIEKTTANFEF